MHREDLIGKIMNYIDDFICIVKSKKDAFFLYYIFFDWLEWLGVQVNKEKCLEPSTIQKVLFMTLLK